MRRWTVLALALLALGWAFGLGEALLRAQGPLGKSAEVGDRFSRPRTVAAASRARGASAKHPARETVSSRKLSAAAPVDGMRAGEEREPLFEEAFAYTEDRAAVRIHGKWGFVDPAGGFVVSPDYDYVWPYLDGLALVKRGEKFGYVDHEGHELTAVAYDTAFGFTDGLGAVSLEGRFGFIDRQGRAVVPTQYDYAWPFQNGLALVKLGERLFYVDVNGRYIRDHE